MIAYFVYGMYLVFALILTFTPAAESKIEPEMEQEQPYGLEEMVTDHVRYR